jgi:hypothetical protein
MPKTLMQGRLMLAVILSGGSGTRLWPLSREAYPKQFLPVVSDDSLLAETIDRGLGLGDDIRVMAITNEEHRFVVAAHMHSGAGDRTAGIVLEPVGRNTAPAIALAALAAAEQNPAELMLVMPSDHVLKNAEAFGKAVAYATHRLWLYQGRSESGRLQRRGGICGEAGCCHGTGLSGRGGLLLEQRDFPVPGGSLPEGAGRAPARDDERLSCRLGKTGGGHGFYPGG